MPQVGPIRLNQAEYVKLNEYVERDGRTQADVIREAISRYVDGYYTANDDKRLQERDKAIVDAMKSMENRFALLITRLGIDLEALYALGWSLTSNLPDRHEMFEKCQQVGVTRWRRKTKGIERHIIRSLLHFSNDSSRSKSTESDLDDEEIEEELEEELPEEKPAKKPPDDTPPKGKKR